MEKQAINPKIKNNKWKGMMANKNEIIPRHKLNNIYNRNTNVKSSQSFTQTYDGGKAMGEEMSWYVQTNRWGMHIPVTSKKL